MKRSYHEILEYIYDNDEVGIRELCKSINRKHNDHRDFYGLAALLKEGFIEFTGPIMDHSLHQAYLFQCYSQGEGEQRYKEASLMGDDNKDSYLFIGAKGISYFHQRLETRKGWYIVATLALITSVLSAVIVSYLTK